MRRAEGKAGYLAEFHRLFREYAPGKKGSMARARPIGGTQMRAIEQLNEKGEKVLLQLVRDQLGRTVSPAHRLDGGTSGCLIFLVACTYCDDAQQTEMVVPPMQATQ